MNFSATLNVFRLIRDPALCIPHATIPTFNHLPIPLSKAFLFRKKGHEPDIRAVVLDKDNCFAKPKDNVIHQPYIVRQLTSVSLLRKKQQGPPMSFILVIQLCSFQIYIWQLRSTITAGLQNMIYARYGALDQQDCID